MRVCVCVCACVYDVSCVCTYRRLCVCHTCTHIVSASAHMSHMTLFDSRQRHLRVRFGPNPSLQTRRSRMSTAVRVGAPTAAWAVLPCSWPRPLRSLLATPSSGRAVKSRKGRHSNQTWVRSTWGNANKACRSRGRAWCWRVQNQHRSTTVFANYGR